MEKQGKETKYALRLIPLGGFVNMEGEEERSEKKVLLVKQVYQRELQLLQQVDL